MPIESLSPLPTLLNFLVSFPPRNRVLQKMCLKRSNTLSRFFSEIGSRWFIAENQPFSPGREVVEKVLSGLSIPERIRLQKAIDTTTKQNLWDTFSAKHQGYQQDNHTTPDHPPGKTSPGGSPMYPDVPDPEYFSRRQKGLFDSKKVNLLKGALLQDCPEHTTDILTKNLSQLRTIYNRDVSFF